MKKKYFVILLFALFYCIATPEAYSVENTDFQMYNYRMPCAPQTLSIDDIMNSDIYTQKKLNVKSNYTSPNCLMKERWDGKFSLKLSTGERYEYGYGLENAIQSYKIIFKVSVEKTAGNEESIPVANNIELSMRMGDRNDKDNELKVAELISPDNLDLFYENNNLIDNLHISNISLESMIINGDHYDIPDPNNSERKIINWDLNCGQHCLNRSPELSAFVRSIQMDFNYDAKLKILPFNQNDISTPLIYVKYYSYTTSSNRYSYYDSDPLSQGNMIQPIRFEWESIDECAGSKIPYYHIQILRLENTNVEVPTVARTKAKIDWSKALNLYTSNGQKYIDLRLTEGSGIYLWRVRPVGNYYPGDMANDLNYGKWNSIKLYEQNPPVDIGIVSYPYLNTTDTYDSDDDSRRKAIVYYKQWPSYSNWPNGRNLVDKTNWMSSKIITEDENNGTKISENITYYDDLMRPRQSQSINNTDNVSLVSQMYYDYVGRNVLTTLAFPKKETDLSGDFGLNFNYLPDQHSGLYYKNDIINTTAPTNGEYNDFLYSNTSISDNDYKSSGGDLNEFYDGNDVLGANITKKDVIPSAEGFPFVRTKYAEDGTGSVVAQGNVGETFSHFDNSSDDHTTRVSYTSVADEEIVPLFGNETPAANTVKKIITTDPNNVQSVSYVNKEGQVIATAVVPTSSSLEGLGEDYKTPNMFIYNVYGYSSYGKPYTYLASKDIDIRNSSSSRPDVTINYSLALSDEPIRIADLCDGMLDETTNKLELEVKSKVTLAQNGTSIMPYENEFTTLPVPLNSSTVSSVSEGQYTASRVLTITNVDQLRTALISNIQTKFKNSNAYKAIYDNLSNDKIIQTIDCYLRAWRQDNDVEDYTLEKIYH